MRRTSRNSWGSTFWAKADRAGDARVVHEGVDGTELARGALDHGRDGLGVGDVGGGCQGRRHRPRRVQRSRPRPRRRCGAFTTTRPAVRHELLGDCAADADRAATVTMTTRCPGSTMRCPPSCALHAQCARESCDARRGRPPCPWRRRGAPRALLPDRGLPTLAVPLAGATTDGSREMCGRGGSPWPATANTSGERARTSAPPRATRSASRASSHPRAPRSTPLYAPEHDGRVELPREARLPG